MQDRFSFRLYNSEACEMLYDIQDREYLGNWLMHEQYHLMQCTGLTDKNDRLIYEGDIIKITTGEIFEVTFNNSYACYCIENKKFMRYLKEVTWYSQNLEIIGNIYENPELLKEVE